VCEQAVRRCLFAPSHLSAQRHRRAMRQYDGHGVIRIEHGSRLALSLRRIEATDRLVERPSASLNRDMLPWPEMAAFRQLPGEKQRPIAIADRARSAESGE